MLKCMLEYSIIFNSLIENIEFIIPESKFSYMLKLAEFTLFKEQCL